MHILIIGAAGMVGRKLTSALVKAGRVGGKAIEQLDAGRRDRARGAGRFHRQGRDASPSDLSAPGDGGQAGRARPDLIFHLAAIVSGEAEADFDKGYRINLDGTRFLLEAIRQEGLEGAVHAAARLHLVDRGVRRAVPGSDRRRVLLDPAHQLRHAEGDLRAAAQRLFAQGLCRRRRHPAADHRGPPGQAEPRGLGLLLQHPARAAGRPGSGAAGQPRRPPLVRQPARRGRLPDPRRRARHGKLGWRRTLSVPGLSATVGEEIEALRRVAGEKAVRLIQRRAGRDDHQDRRRLAAQLRRQRARHSASRPSRASTRSSAPISRTSSAARSAARPAA